MQKQSFYIRIRGKVTGPFGFEQLKSLRNRGQLRRFHELSEDRQTWVPASAIAQLFGDETATGVELVDAAPSEEPANRNAPALDWHYLDGAGSQQGPVPTETLLTLLQKGTIKETTLVWRTGLPNWVELGSPQAGIILRQGGAGASAEALRSAGSVGAGLSALKGFLVDPVGGLPSLCHALGGGGALALGILFCLLFDFCLVSGFVLAGLRFADYLGPRALTTGAEPQVRHIANPGNPLVDFFQADTPVRSKLEFLVKLFLIAFLPVVSLAAAIAIVRTITRGQGNIGFDVLISGSSLLPIGVLSPLAALLGPGNIEVILFLYVLILCLTILILNSAFTRIVKLSDQGTILAIPAALVLTLWLSKIVVFSVILG
jgi:GYF domain 2